MNTLVLRLSDIFHKRKPIIGVIHLPPLPGSPNYENTSLNSIIKRAINDGMALEQGGVDGVIVENFWDSPFEKTINDPVTIASMTLVTHKIREKLNIPVGVNLLRNSAIEAAAIASATNSKFIRVNVYVETVATDSGIIEPIAPILLRYMKQRNISLGILADVHVKHGKVIGERSIIETAKDALTRGGATAVIVTGKRTGEPPEDKVLKSFKSANVMPVIIGSGLKKENIGLLEYVNGAIVGTYFKEKGQIEQPVSVERVRDFMELVESFR